MNEQRKVVFEQRIDFMRAESVNDNVRDMRHQIVDDLVPRYVPPKAYPDQWDMDGLREEIGEIYNLDIPLSDWANEEGIADEEIITRLHDAVDRARRAPPKSGRILCGRLKNPFCCKHSTSTGATIW